MTPTEQDDELRELLAVNGLPHDEVEGSIIIDLVTKYFIDKLKNLPEMQYEQPEIPVNDYHWRIRNELRTAILKSWEE